MMRPLPIRVRLTLWYSLVFAAALLCIGIASLWMVHRAVTQLEDNELQQRVRSVRRFLEARPRGESDEHLRQSIAAAYDVSHGNKWLQVIDEHGRWLYRSPHVAAVYPQLALPRQAQAAGSYFSYTADSIHVRGLIEPIVVHGVYYNVQTGLTLDKSLSILSSFRIQLWLLAVAGLAVSSLAGYFMSGKALSPIAAIACEAQRINDKNLNVRLPDLQTRDELAALSITLNQMLARIEAGYQSVRSFTASAAHELRSPVALLRAETEVALTFPRDAGYYRETCRHVLQNSIQMSHTIDQLLSLARMDASVEIFHSEPVNLPDLIDETADEWYERFEQAGVQLNLGVPSPELWVHADFLALKRLLNILIENAWRYTPAGQAVTIGLVDLGQNVEMSVADTGLGIAAEDQRRVFERFFRAARPLHGEFAGSGLGLPLGQRIAEGHGSRLDLQSVSGRGSRFSLLLAKSSSRPGQTDASAPQPLLAEQV
jgi:signal transduction histidine kinase